MDERLLELLCAPGSQAPLRLADSMELARINSRIQSRSIRNRNGSIIEAELDGALICESERTCFPIQSGLPVLIAGEAFVWPISP